MIPPQKSTGRLNHTESLIEKSMVNLFEAIIQKNTQKVKSILEQGANPNSIIDTSALSVMHFLCQSTAGIFKYLLEFGGSIFNRDSDGVSVIECASNNPEIYRLLRKKILIGG